MERTEDEPVDPLTPDPADPVVPDRLEAVVVVVEAAVVEVVPDPALPAVPAPALPAPVVAVVLVAAVPDAVERLADAPGTWRDTTTPMTTAAAAAPAETSRDVRRTRRMATSRRAVPWTRGGRARLMEACHHLDLAVPPQSAMSVL